MYKRKFTTVAIVVAMMLTLLAPMQVSAASGGGTLVKAVNRYSYNQNTKSWVKVDRTTFKYTKKFPTSFTRKDYRDKTTETTTAYYKMSKGVPTKGSHYDSRGKKYEAWTYKGGKLTRSKSGSSSSSSTSYYTYNRVGYVSKFYSTSVDTSVDESRSFGYRYKYTTQNGLPKSMKSWSIDSTSDAYNLITYNSKGFVTSEVYVDSDGKKYPQSAIKYVFKKGKLVSAITYYYPGGKKTLSDKFTFSYTNNKINKKRYANMINSIINLGFHGSSNGAYVWY